jgi:trehalose-phosphatase
VNDLAIRLGLRLVDGKMVFELRPNVRVDKGSAVLALADRLDGLVGDASLLFAGDDTTDEDAFRALRARSRRPVTIRVGDSGTTAAEFVATDTDAMRDFLAWVLRSRSALDAGSRTTTGAP